MRVQIINSGELKEPFPSPRNALEKLHVHLQAVAGLALLVALPPLGVSAMLLIRGEPVYTVPHQDAMHGRQRHDDAVKAPQVIRDSPWAEVMVLAQVQDLADDVA
jgi:hypothetical protein